MEYLYVPGFENDGKISVKLAQVKLFENTASFSSLGGCNKSCFRILDYNSDRNQPNSS